MNDTLKDKFFSDPDWKLVEDLIHKHIDPLRDMSNIDLSQAAEHVKADLIGRITHYNALSEFLNDTLLVSRKLNKIDNPYR